MFEKKDGSDGEKLRMEMTVSMCNETISLENKKTIDFKKPAFKDISQYEKAIIES
jgi:hypothetical protein